MNVFIILLKFKFIRTMKPPYTSSLCLSWQELNMYSDLSHPKKTGGPLWNPAWGLSAHGHTQRQGLGWPVYLLQGMLSIFHFSRPMISWFSPQASVSWRRLEPTIVQCWRLEDIIFADISLKECQLYFSCITSYIIQIWCLYGAHCNILQMALLLLPYGAIVTFTP